MKYKGFTLAEVLITLGIIGVVAALTAPALYQDVSNAHIGPTLSKFKSTLENANYQMLNDAGATDLAELGNVNDYATRLMNFVSSSQVLNNENCDPAVTFLDDINASNLCNTNMTKVQLIDNVTMILNNNPGVNYSTTDTNLSGALYNALVDINGITRRPNQMGMDIFEFIIDRNGTVVPAGGIMYATDQNNALDQNLYWDGSDAFRCNENASENGRGCAGSIFENRLKVIYK